MNEDEIRTWYLCKNMWGHWKVNTGQRIAFLSGLYALPIWSQQVGHLWNLNPGKRSNRIEAQNLATWILGERCDLSFSHRISAATIEKGLKADLPDVFCCHFCWQSRWISHSAIMLVVLPGNKIVLSILLLQTHLLLCSGSTGVI